jgi:hypothetical protein
VIRHDVDWTMGPMPAHSAEMLALAMQNRMLREVLAAILRAGDRAARGGRLVEVHGECVVFLGGEQWQALRRAMIAAGDRLMDERGPMN